MSLRSPYPWFGGKSKVAHIVWQRFGDVPNYVEPFAGSMATLLLRPHWPWEGNRVETVNDFDCYVSNFWRALQADPEGVAQYADWPVNDADLRGSIAGTEGFADRAAATVGRFLCDGRNRVRSLNLRCSRCHDCCNCCRCDWGRSTRSVMHDRSRFLLLAPGLLRAAIICGVARFRAGRSHQETPEHGVFSRDRSFDGRRKEAGNAIEAARNWWSRSSKGSGDSLLTVAALAAVRGAA